MAFGGGIATVRRRARRQGAVENGAYTRGCLCALGEPCKQHGEGSGDLQGEIGVY